MNQGVVLEEYDMPSRNPLREIRVFISSMCGDKSRYDEMRSALASRLEETSVFEAYLWERSGSSSSVARDNYISAINDCDICVVIIDNQDGVSEGVRNEVDHILRYDKRALFYFCNEHSDKKTDVQLELEGADGPTFKTINCMAHIPSQVVSDLQEDVFLLYRKWCNHDIEYSGAAKNAFSADATVRFPQEANTQLSGLREVIGQFVFGGEIEQKPVNQLDAETVKLAKALYIDTSITSFNADGLVTFVESSFPQSYSEVIARRWEGNCLYLNGQIEKSIGFLESALELTKQRGLATWFENDILVDLRNITSEKNKSLFVGNKYQTQLINSGEEVVFPLLDRRISKTFEDIEKDRIKGALQEYSSYTIGENALRFIDPICGAFAIAACFGSLTHLSNTLLRLKYVVHYLCTKYQDANLYSALLKLSIVCGKRGDAEKTIQAFNDIRFDSDPKSAKEVFDFCAKYKCLGSKEEAVFEAFATTGCYLSDADFTSCSAVFVQRVENSLEKTDRWEPVPASIFNAMSVNASRLQLSWMIDVVIRAISSRQYFWIVESLRFLTKSGSDLLEIENVQFRRLLEIIRELAVEDSEHNYSNYICDALITICSNAGKTFCVEIDYIAALLPDNLQEHYKNATDRNNDAGLKQLIEGSLARIVTSNEMQGKNGVYYSGADNHLMAARRIEAMDEPSLEMGKRLYALSIDTLFNAHIDLRSKVQACEAMCRMLCIFGSGAFDRQTDINKLSNSKGILLQSRSIGKETKLLFRIWLDVLLALAGASQYDDLCSSIAKCYRADVYTQAQAGEAVLCLVKSSDFFDKPGSLRGVLFSYACFLAKSLHFQLNLRGLEILASFMRDADFRHPAARVLFDGYTGQSPVGKRIIIDSIDAIKQFDESLADELRAKILRDSTTTAVAYLHEKEAVKDIGC